MHVRLMITAKSDWPSVVCEVTGRMLAQRADSSLPPAIDGLPSPLTHPAPSIV